MHDRCDENRCTSASVDPMTYKPQHVETCATVSSSCRMVGVQSSVVAGCIKRGRIPLIKFKESSDGTELEVIESHRALRYVALSHVWSGGLGNVNANSIFACQLRKIKDLLSSLRKTADDHLDQNLAHGNFQMPERRLRDSLDSMYLSNPCCCGSTLCVSPSALNTKRRGRPL